MDSVRTARGATARVFHRFRAAACGRRRRSPSLPGSESHVLDVVYVLGVLALFVIVGLIGKAVEKL